MPRPKILTDEQRKERRRIINRRASAKRYALHKEEVLASHKKSRKKTGYSWRNKFPEKAKLADDKWQSENTEKYKASQKAAYKRRKHDPVEQEKRRIADRKNYAKNKDKIAKRNKIRYDADPEKFRSRGRNDYKINTEKRKSAHAQWELDNKEYRTQYRKELSEKNKPKRNAKRRERYKNDPVYRLECLLRAKLSTLLKRGSIQNRPTGALKLLGCSLDSFKMYIESKFEPGMSWQNHGEWHLDHTVACALFDLGRPEHQKYCFHFSNYHPMWAKPNMQKHTKAPPNFNLTQHLSTPLAEAPTTQPNKAETISAQLGN